MKSNEEFVLLDVHGFLPKELRNKAAQVRFNGFGRLTAKNDPFAALLQRIEALGKKQNIRLVWTGHHTYNVLNALINNYGWSKKNAESYVDACKVLVVKSGGKVFSNLNYKTDAETDEALYLELCRIAARLDQDDTEDAAIIKMAMTLKVDRLISNDGRVKRVKNFTEATGNAKVQTIIDLWNDIKSESRSRMAA